jgi:hypothetical protein
VWLVRKFPLGHKIMLLTSGFHASPTIPAVFALVTGVGFKSHWDTPVGAHTSPARLLLGSSVAHEPLHRLGRFDRILVPPDPDGEPPRRGELGTVSRSRGAMPRNVRRHQLVLAMGRWLC